MGSREKSIRPILVKVWQRKPLFVGEFLALTDEFEAGTVIEVLRALDEKQLTTSDAEDALLEGPKKQKQLC